MADEEQQETNRKSGIAYAAAFTLFVSVASMCGIGWLLDRWLGTAPWLMAGGLILGAIVGLFEFFRLASKLD